ncbi:MAG: IS3 family transposase, partial [Gammaproteobacteria bacterium]|nr:IS3 family transposase [Gammaproteobacteria bacterium]
MQTLGLQAKGKRKYKTTTNSNHTLPVAPNLLKQDFEASAPHQKWVSDITYVWTDEGWLYLAVVLDVYSRLVVGYALSARIDRALVITVLRRALFRRKFPREVIAHSDRGSQYCSADCQVLLTKHGLVCSMRKRGDCYDNAAMESGNHSYKVDTQSRQSRGSINMAHYVMVGEGDYPAAYIKKTHREHLENDLWITGDILTFKVPVPILYDLKLTEIFDPDTDSYVYEGAPKTLYDANPIPCMHISLLDALTAAGVDNLQTYDAVLRDLTHGIEYKDYKAFNVVG